MLAYFLKINVAIALFFMRSTGYFSIKTRSSRGAEPLLLCFFCHFCRLSATEYTDMDHGTGAYGSHGRFIR